MPPPPVRKDPDWGFRYYDPCPEFTPPELPEGAKITIPRDGGFWVVDELTGIRYRRLTMADLPKHVTFNTRGKASDYED